MIYAWRLKINSIYWIVVIVFAKNVFQSNKITINTHVYIVEKNLKYIKIINLKILNKNTLTIVQSVKFHLEKIID